MWKWGILKQYCEGRWKLGASFWTWRENEWNFIMKDHQHQQNGRLQRLLVKSCTQFSAMLKVWCIQNLWLMAQPLTLWSNVKHWESWKYYFKEFFITCSSLSYSMTVLNHTQVQEQMQKCNALVHPSYSPNLAPSDFLLFLKWKDFSGDNAIHWMMKSGEWLSCGYNNNNNIY